MGLRGAVAALASRAAELLAAALGVLSPPACDLTEFRGVRLAAPRGVRLQF